MISTSEWNRHSYPKSFNDLESVYIGDNWRYVAILGQPNEDMYLKQAEHLMKKGVLAPALSYIDTAIKLNPHSKVCHILAML